MTQVEHVRAHIVAGKSISPQVALMVYGIYRLSSVIEDLRALGYEIDTIYKHDELGKQYGEYRIRKPIVRGSTVQVLRGHGYGLPNWVRKLRNAVVIATSGDTALVRFIRGKNLADVWMNHKELVNAD